MSNVAVAIAPTSSVNHLRPTAIRHHEPDFITTDQSDQLQTCVIGFDSTTGTFQLPPNLQIQQGFIGAIEWTLDNDVPDGVTFAAETPIVFVMPEPIASNKKFPGGSINPVVGGRQLLLQWQNNKLEFERQTFTYYIFLNVPGIDHPVRVDPTVENLPPS